MSLGQRDNTDIAVHSIVHLASDKSLGRVRNSIGRHTVPTISETVDNTPFS